LLDLFPTIALCKLLPLLLRHILVKPSATAQVSVRQTASKTSFFQPPPVVPPFFRRWSRRIFAFPKRRCCCSHFWSLHPCFRTTPVKEGSCNRAEARWSLAISNNKMPICTSISLRPYLGSLPQSIGLLRLLFELDLRTRRSCQSGLIHQTNSARFQGSHERISYISCKNGSKAGRFTI
jgi:hypothetical protein